MESDSEIKYRPIGFFQSDKKAKLQAARQGAEDAFTDLGVIELLPGQNFEQALEDLNGFSYIWLVFDFHLNKTWKTKVMPPRFSDKKLGVFATRSPYRPNQIGLSCVRLEKIQGRKVYVSGSDLLAGTPILDIKPYLVSADCHPKAKKGWIGDHLKKQKTLRFQKSAEQKLIWLQKQGLTDFPSVLEQQLSTDPFNNNSKRVKKISATTGEFALRKWRITFKVSNKSISIQNIESNFKKSDKAHPEDSVHLKFLKEFGRTKN